MVVKDRNDDDKIVVCVRQHGKYRWEMINGTYVVSNMLFKRTKEPIGLVMLHVNG